MGNQELSLNNREKVLEKIQGIPGEQKPEGFAFSWQNEKQKEEDYSSEPLTVWF